VRVIWFVLFIVSAARFLLQKSNCKIAAIAIHLFESNISAIEIPRWKYGSPDSTNQTQTRRNLQRILPKTQTTPMQQPNKRKPRIRQRLLRTRKQPNQLHLLQKMQTTKPPKDGTRLVTNMPAQNNSRLNMIINNSESPNSLHPMEENQT
jgi:hypothetical protein